MEAKVGVFGRGMASVKIQYYADDQPYGMFKARPALVEQWFLTQCLALLDVEVKVVTRD